MRDPFRDPITSENSLAYKFLNLFVQWIRTWSSFEAFEKQKKIGKYCGKLSLETQFSLTHTVTSLLELIKYLLNKCILKYVLLGKFQNDDIESRFGRYRQMSGGNYHITVTQVLESERRLKSLSLIKMMSSTVGEFSIKDIVIEEPKGSEKDLWDQGTVESEYPDLLDEIINQEISDSEQMALIYIAGYAIHKICKSINCKSCLSTLRYDCLLELEKESEGETASEYLKFIDRGGLKKPKPEFVLVFVYILQLFKCLASAEYEESFLQCKSQKQLLCSLSLNLVKERTNIFHAICQTCKKSISSFSRNQLQRLQIYF